jgi:hypothetical protein
MFWRLFLARLAKGQIQPTGLPLGLIKDGNGYEISAYPQVPNLVGADTGLDLCPRVWAWVQL